MSSLPVCCLIGTRAQLIKMAPVLLELEHRRIPCKLLLSGQHRATMHALLAEFGLNVPRQMLYDGAEVSSLLATPFWFFACLWRLMRHRHYLPAQTPLLLTHGDTLSTLLAALAGRLHGIPVAHVESGLRSFHWRQPFPEELIRLAVFRLSQIFFCPDKTACRNLTRHPSPQVVNTNGNTLADAVHLALKQKQSDDDWCLPASWKSYAVASLHRFENIFSARRLKRIIILLEQAASACPLVFVLHPATERRLRRYRLLDRLRANERIVLAPRQSYFPFVRLLRDARFVISDGGSNQEELAYLGKPTLLMRSATERLEGLDTTAQLCYYDADHLGAFLAQLPPSGAVSEPQFPAGSPSARIVDFIARRIAESASMKTSL